MTVALALLATLATQNPTPAAPTPEAVAAAVRQLGDADYRVRDRASQWLWAAGAAAEPALREGLKSTDAEVVARCRDLLDEIPFGITPDMPRRFVELIAAARAGGPTAWPEVVPDLLDLGPRGLAIAQQLIERLGTTAGQRDALRVTLDREGWRVGPALLADRQFDRAAELLERSAVAGPDTAAPRHYAAFLAERGQLDAQLPRWRAWAERGDESPGANGRRPDGSPDAKAARSVLVHLARLRGDWPLARATVEKLEQPDLREAILFDQGVWADLIDFPPPNQASPIIKTGLKALYQQLAGQDAGPTLAEVKKLGDVPTYASTWLATRAFMFAGRPNDALALLAKSKVPDAVLPQFEVLCQLHRYDEAFKLLDRPVNEHAAQRWQWDTARIRIHHLRGETDKARAILSRLTAIERLNPAETAPAQELVEQLVALGRTEDALPIAAALLANAAAARSAAGGLVQFNSSVNPTDVFGKLFPRAPLAAEIWWRFLCEQHPAEPMRTTVARLPALLDARLAGAEGQALLEATAKAARSRSAAEADRWLQGLGEACQEAGLGDAAKRLCEEATAKADSAAAWLKLGDFHADAGRWPDAAAAYERAWRKDVKQPQPLWLYGYAKQRAGAAGGPEMMELAHVIPLGDADIRAVFADDLVKRSHLGPEPPEAARRERRLLLRLVNLYRPGVTPEKPDRGRNTQGSLSSDLLAFTDHLDAADGTQRFLVRMMRTNAIFKRNDGYLVVLHRLYANRARGLLAKGDVNGALREAAAAHQAIPDAVSPTIYLVPELTRQGRSAEADAVYAAPAATLDKLCRDWPNGAGFHNNRAWLAVRCGRELDGALTHARTAVELDPKSATYQETLAEVLFQRGDRPAAVERIKRAVELDPKNSYYTEQKRRIEAGDRSAPIPQGR